MRLALFIFAAGLCWGQASPVNPTLPLSIPPGVRPTPTGSVIAIHSGTDLQATYNSAACGSDLVLDAGITKSGNFVFNKQCTAPNWILVEGAGCNAGTVPIPTYVTTATPNLSANPLFAPPSLANYATITTSNGVPPLVTTDSMNNAATYNYFGCLEVTSPANSQFYMVGITNNAAETLASQLGDHIILDRMYVHGIPASSTVQIIHGVIVAGSNISVVNSYISQMYSSGNDAQAILGIHGPGPYLITNNFLEASTENILFGGVGKSPSYTCTIAASPTPTTTSATVNTCKDAGGNTVPTPPIGTQVMFFTSSSAPNYSPLDFATITGNTAGALTFAAIPTAPLAGVTNTQWGIMPADITITKNVLYKPPQWNSADPSYDGVTRSSKNFIEAKYGLRWNINANVMVNTYNQGQQYAFNLNSADQDANCPWCRSSDITVTNNVIKNSPGDFAIISTQSATNCPPILNRVLFSNNLFFTIGSFPFNASGGRIWSMTRDNGACTYPQQQATDSLQVIHNTMLGANANAILSDDNPFNYSNLLIRDNLTEFDQFRWFLVSGGCVDPCFSLSTSSGSWTTTKNAIINSGAINGSSGVSDAVLISKYSSGILPILYDTTAGMNYAGAPFASYSTVNADYHGFALNGSTPWINAASDGTNPGVNFATLDAALGGGTPPPPLTCDLNHDGLVNALDVQLQTNQALGVSSCTNPLGGACNATSVQRVINAALGAGCNTGP